MSLIQSHLLASVSSFVLGFYFVKPFVLFFSILLFFVMANIDASIILISSYMTLVILLVI